MASNVTTIYRARTERIQTESRFRTNNQIIMLFGAVVFTLVVIGLGATISASSTVGINWEYGQYHFFFRQLLGVLLGTVVLLVTSRVPYQLYRRFAVYLFVGALALLFLVLLVGVEVGGSSRWLRFGPLGFEPSELAKFAVIVLMASLISRGRGVFDDLKSYTSVVLLVLGSVGFLLIQQPDFGTTVLIVICAFVVLWVGGAPLSYMAGSTAVAAGLAILLAVIAPYRLDRLRGFLDPWGDAADTGYQLIQSWVALGTGGLWGVGPGNSRARWFYLPNAHTDFIFAIIGEEIGLVGGLFVITLFVVLVVLGWMVARRAPDHFGQMLAAGITAWLGFQGLINVGGVLGWMPITGITLPFISYGVSSLVVNMGALGVLLNGARQGRSPVGVRK
ncbi:MAG: putative lipid II flippase FtsW [Acidimicrobiia bacterium]|nr:putative lipid II flippase FtsW [Acidimicrobiia bacterium]MYB79026.1 putative lipid II flippase FtsW [Acidimicrobiia bacterium]MYD41160.1 putative lipid II flippase FtsW [Acidimicrobiia bacterium]